jgi:N-ethylmaleimide reductase
MADLFSPLRLGAIELKHRIVMAPLTRLRSRQPGDIPWSLNAVYYAQRASQGGLLISEATHISQAARGYPGAPGICTAEQIEGWREVISAVHAKAGFFFLQIWHTGRISHSSMQPDGRVPASASAVKPKGKHMNAQWQSVEFETPRALGLDEIKQIIADFKQGAINARAAGADGVEVHAANGYLIDQFLQDRTNQRTDIYGGSIENRARFLLEVVDAISGAIGAERIGVRIAPWGRSNDMGDSDPIALFDYVARALGQRGLAYLHIVEPRADQRSDDNAIDASAPDASKQFKAAFGGPVIAAGGFTLDSAAATLASGHADAIAFGRSFIANPDLVERFKKKAPLNAYDRATFYGGEAKGYTDYPALTAAS